MHMLSRRDFKLRRTGGSAEIQNTTVAVTANGQVQANEEAQVFVHDLDLFVTVQLIVDTLAVLSLGKLFEEHGYSCEWVSGQKPRLTKEGKTMKFKTDNFVPLVVPGFSSSSGGIFSSASPRQDSSSTSPSPAQELLDWFTDNLEDTEVPAPAHIWKVWWLDNGWSQSPQRGGWISKQSPVRCRGTRSCHSMVPSLSGQNKNVSVDGKEFTKVSRADTKANSYLHWQLIN